MALKQKNFNDEINNFFMHSYCSKTGKLRDAHDKSLNEMKELKTFQSASLDTIARRRLVEDQDTFLDLTGKIQELQNEIICMNDSRDFQDAQSVRSGNSHVTSQPVSFPPHPILGGMLSRSKKMPEPQRRAAKHLGHTWKIGKRFCKSSSVFFSTLPAGIESMESDSDRRSIQKLNGIIESQRSEINHTLAEDSQLRRDQQLLHWQLSEQHRDLREAHMKSLNEMEELKRFQGSTFEHFIRKWAVFVILIGQNIHHRM